MTNERRLTYAEVTEEIKKLIESDLEDKMMRMDALAETPAQHLKPDTLERMADDLERTHNEYVLALNSALSALASRYDAEEVEHLTPQFSYNRWRNERRIAQTTNQL